MNTSIPIPVRRVVIEGIRYLWDRNTNELYNPPTNAVGGEIHQEAPIGRYDPEDNSLEIYEYVVGDDEEDDEDETLEMITDSCDRLKEHFKSSIKYCQKAQLDTELPNKVQFYVKEENRNRQCGLFAKMSGRYVLETRAEKKNKLKKHINILFETIKTECLEMIEDTDINEGLYLLCCDLSKKRYEQINDLMRLIALSDDLTAV